MTLDAATPSCAVPRLADAWGRLRATLSWTQPAGLSQPRLRLGCLWESRTGDQGVVQVLGGLTEAPRIAKRRTVWVTESAYGTSEEIDVNLYRNIRRLRRLLLFAYADDGAPDWDALGAVLTIKPPHDDDLVEMWVDKPVQGTSTCVLATMHAVDGILVVRREMDYVSGPQSLLAQAYGWDLHWVQGRTITRTASTY
jgi:tellurite resistance protein TerA